MGALPRDDDTGSVAVMVLLVNTFASKIVGVAENAISLFDASNKEAVDVGISDFCAFSWEALLF